MLFFPLSGQSDTVSKKDNEKAQLVMVKSPWGAVGRSAVVPGWGQYYNESYWKIPVVIGSCGWFLYNALDNQTKYKKYSDSYNITNSYADLKRRDFYRDQRDEFYIYAGLAYLLSLVDAYVDAHMFDFNVIDDTGGEPGNGVKITYTYRF